MKRILLSTLAGLCLSASSAMAAPFVINAKLANIGSLFDNVITGTGATVVTAQVTDGDNVYTYLDINGVLSTVTVTRPSGAALPTPSGGYGSGGQVLSGSVWNINPQTSGADLIPGFNSGLKFTFSSPVNAFGFEVGDWATCCTTNVRPAAVQATYGVPATGSGLWIAFDGGAATLPANAFSSADNPGFAGGGNSFTNFIGAIDSSGFFSSVTFFGDGFGEFLVVGGTLRFASVPAGSVGGDPVPEPATLVLLGSGLAVVLLRRRRQSA